MHGFHPVDLVALIVILLNALNGMRRGLSREIAGTISAILALFLGIELRRPLGELVAEDTRVGPMARPALAFALTVLLAVIVMVLLRILLKHTIHIIIDDKAVDRSGGMLAGLVKSTIIVMIVFLLLGMWPHKYLHRIFAIESWIGRTVVESTPEFRDQAKEVRRILRDD